MKIRSKNEVMQKLISDLNKAGHEKKVRLWRSIAERLNRPTRNYPQVNLYKLEKYAEAKGYVIVPGKVLASGEIRKSVKVAAVNFSEEARRKISGKGGSCISIKELFESNPEGKGVQIIE